MYRLTEKERIEWFVLECKMKLIERASWRDYPYLMHYHTLGIKDCFPDYIDEDGNFYEISCFESQHYVGNLSTLEEIYENVRNELWDKKIIHNLWEENKNLFEEDCYELAENL